MCIPNSTITEKVSELVELKKMADDIAAEIGLIEDQIKDYMGKEESMPCGTYMVRYQSVVTQRLDTAKLKKDLGTALDGYYKVIESRRFSVK